MTPQEHAEIAASLLRTAQRANRTDPRRDQDARLAQTHALLGIYGLLEQLANPRILLGVADRQDDAPLDAGTFLAFPNTEDGR
jgi:hypothetical protein